MTSIEFLVFLFLMSLGCCGGDLEMDQHDHQQSLLCKFCDRTFSCGQSLAGHMKSHVMNLASDTSDDARLRSLSSPIKENSENGKLSFQQISQNNVNYTTATNFSLRENPKHTAGFQRLDEEVNAGVSNENICNLCGKGFPSGKALSGHMKCHSEKLPVNSNDALEVSTSSHSLHSNNDFHSTHQLTKRSSGRMLSKTNPVSNISLANASHSDDAENEQQDGARSLMMLSKDCWGKKEFESSAGKDEVSVRSKAGIEIDMQQTKMHNEENQISKKSGDSEFSKRASKRNKFQCTACNKIFNSYQALGGHRASHKKIKGCFASKMIQPPEHDSEKDRPVTIKTESDLTANPSNKSHVPLPHGNNTGKSKKHGCSFCFKVFSSGQALGGHKRTHLNNPAPIDSNQGIVIQKPMTKSHDLLDLNLPAPAEDDTPTPVTDFSR